MFRAPSLAQKTKAVIEYGKASQSEILEMLNVPAMWLCRSACTFPPAGSLLEILPSKTTSVGSMVDPASFRGHFSLEREVLY